MQASVRSRRPSCLGRAGTGRSPLRKTALRSGSGSGSGSGLALALGLLTDAHADAAWITDVNYQGQDDTRTDPFMCVGCQVKALQEASLRRLFQTIEPHAPDRLVSRRSRRRRKGRDLDADWEGGEGAVGWEQRG
eukprot:1230586-Rhodomonas_salina.2